MEYTKQTWETGDVVTANKLNHMETGIYNANHILLVTENATTHALDKNYSEIESAISSGGRAIISLTFEDASESATSYGVVLATGTYLPYTTYEPEQTVYCIDAKGAIVCFATSEITGYPVRKTS